MRVMFRCVHVVRLLFSLLFVAASSFAHNCTAAITYLNNLDPGGSSENSGSLGIVGPAKVAIGFDIITPQDGSWTFTIRIFNPDPALVGLQLFVDNTDVGAINGHQPGASSPFSLGTPSSTPGGGVDRFTVAVSGSGLLSAGKYWLVGSTTSPTPDQWDWFNGNSSYDVNGGSPDDATFYGVRLSTAGTSWNSSAANTLSLGIDVTPVPEPVHAALIAGLFLIVCSATHLIRRHLNSAPEA